VTGREIDLLDPHAIVSDREGPVRMTKADVAGNPRLSRFRRSAAGHPLLEGWLAAPLTGRRGRNLGIIQVADKVEGDFTEIEEAILLQLAQMAAVAIENAELYAREHEIAEALQRGLLPDRLPTLEGVSLAARYQPGGASTQVGGDWYDALPIDGGAVALAVGDVAGRGPKAAAVMGQLRTAMRAYALQGMAPAAVMESLDRLLQGLSESYLATSVFAILDAKTGSLRFSNAGHPPPLLLRPDGGAEFLEGALAHPLGVVPDASYVERGVTLEPGSVLVLYTDGLVEERSAVLDDGLAQLRSVVEATSRTTAGERLDDLCQHVLHGMTAFERTDDIALLVARLDRLA
jgi:serine phosphatase RsbU (regulator of sigma subunit)